MATNCYFCNNKLTFLDVSFDLDANHADKRICYDCNQRKETLLIGKRGNVQEAKQFFEEKLGGKAFDKEVVSLVEQWIEQGDARLEQKEAEAKQKEAVREALKVFPVTTGFSFNGYKIIEYKDIVSGEGVLGTGIISDLSNVGADLFGTESNALETKISDARERAQRKMIQRAHAIGATGVIGIRYDLSVLTGNTIAVMATGTAVVMEKES